MTPQLQRLGPYLLLKPLREGGMGKIFLAVQQGVPGILRPCVVKLVADGLADDPQMARRFLHEARTVTALSHRCVPRVLDVGQVGDDVYIAMELVVGRSLRQILRALEKKRLSLPPAVALHIACETLAALDHAHDVIDPASQAPLSIVHRDVSPENVMVDFGGEVKIIDFGLAKSRARPVMTKPGMLLGRLRYMAPERVRGGDVDRRADLYSVAIVLYEMLSNGPYYGALNSDQILSMLIDGGYAPPPTDKIPPVLEQLLATALQDDPKKRFPTCELFRRALLPHVGPASDVLRALINEHFDQAADRAELAALLSGATLSLEDPTQQFSTTDDSTLIEKS